MGKQIRKITGISILIVLLNTINSCNSQEKIKPKNEIKKVTESVWIPESNLYSKIKFDSTLVLVFQTYFDDSVVVNLGDELLFTDRIKTNRSMAVVPKFETIKAMDYDDSKVIRILLVEKEELVTFKIKYGYNFAYISRNRNGIWFIEYSEYQRKYY